MTPLELTIEAMKSVGLTVCADLDDDCEFVGNKEACWQHDPKQGQCPYLAVVRHYQPAETERSSDG